MTVTDKAEKITRVLSILPKRVSDEVVAIARTRRAGLGSIGEIRLRRGGRSTLLSGRETVPLAAVVRAEEMADMIYRLCECSVYAHADTIKEGFVSLGDGIRVGVSGLARYDGGRLVGVGDPSTLVFRIPTGECEVADGLFAAWCSRERISAGMLVYSPPGVGKTTALRSLAANIGRGRDARRVVIVDERGEFSEEDYRCLEVDILRGYKRRAGMEIAVRTMSAEVLIIDEIGGDDAREIAGAVRCGVPVIASAHAASYGELCSKEGLGPMLSSGVFDTFVGIFRTEAGYSLKVDTV
jgi:stage III sporulation protein AA